MSPRTKIRPPFAWLGSHTSLAALASVILSAVLFRFYQLGSLPPGLESGGGKVGVQALALVQQGKLPGLDAATGYAPLWIWLQALSIKLLGHTELALRLWPAVLGTVAVVLLWLWAKQWFGLRIAWLASFLLAVTPWAVTISRNAGPAALLPFMITLTLWVGTLYWRKRSVPRAIAMALVLALNLLSGPVGWLLAGTALLTGAWQLARKKQLFKFSTASIAGGAAVLVALAGFGYLLAMSMSSLRGLPMAAAIGKGLGSNIVNTLLMLNVPGAGDQNWLHNIAGEPLLNAFVGLMLVAGLLVAISRLHELRYRLLFVFLIVLLLPAFLSGVGVPNAAHAAGAMPLIFVLAAIGISYMLELWYRTFPINSAARATGQIMVMILLALSFFQGYTQYFRAWAGSSEIYTAYNEGPTEIASRLRDQQAHAKTKFPGTVIVVTTKDQQPVISYLLHTDTAYVLTDPSGVVAMPVGHGSRQFWISQAARDDAIKAIKAKFPGGHLLPKYSDFNQNEIYYTYEVTK
jgi:hypothetical protein